MLSLKRAGEEGSATPPSDPSCPVPNTRGLPHLQGGETIVGFEGPEQQGDYPTLRTTAGSGPSAEWGRAVKGLQILAPDGKGSGVAQKASLIFMPMGSGALSGASARSVPIDTLR